MKVAFDLESREYNGRWYTDAKAWKIESISAGSSSASVLSSVPMEEMPLPPADDLPF